MVKIVVYLVKVRCKLNQTKKGSEVESIGMYLNARV